MTIKVIDLDMWVPHGMISLIKLAKIYLTVYIIISEVGSIRFVICTWEKIMVVF